ncbi:predicted protein [Plenodomus lingam JN3]|uniref:Predicted protein n=1 Tax=Leptosphaeria maculans (strain JN3 / isolate v23.1.3 / race Av1-4-5-6-7-8) TaxID=985895 RepID=E4ZQV0_LEPMJ|nr:predicted protein [Plenodomus lingam JN3]CBX94105.1 predicted protein [Plenodomus lingam JN3]
MAAKRLVAMVRKTWMRSDMSFECAVRADIPGRRVRDEAVEVHRHHHREMSQKTV